MSCPYTPTAAAGVAAASVPPVAVVAALRVTVQCLYLFVVSLGVSPLGWMSKPAFIFYLDMVHDVLSLGIFLVGQCLLLLLSPPCCLFRRLSLSVSVSLSLSLSLGVSLYRCCLSLFLRPFVPSLFTRV